MKYSENYNISWHDTDANRVVAASKIVTYLQETANHQCEGSGLPLDRLRDERGLGFILASLSLKILKPLHAYEKIEVLTWCQPSRGYTFNRYFEIKRDGELVAMASTVWVLLDIHQKTMVRASTIAEFDGCFYYDEPISPDAVPPRAKIAKDAELCEIGRRKIVYSDIDYNQHMNNTRYPDMLCDFLPEMTSISPAYRISSLSLSYIKESALGDTLTVYRGEAREDGAIPLQTKNQSGDICLEALLTLEEV